MKTHIGNGSKAFGIEVLFNRNGLRDARLHNISPRTNKAGSRPVGLSALISYNCIGASERVIGMPKFVERDASQRYFLPPDLRDWVPEDELAHFFLEPVEPVPMRAF